MRKYNERIIKFMSRAFPSESELIHFMETHMADLYEEFYKAEQEDDNSLMDYVQGSIDTTQVYLLKSGVEKFLTYEQYLDLVNANWKKA